METLIGNGEHLNPIHMGIRAILIFFIALVMIRLGGFRIMGKKSGFDLVIIIMLGAVLARAIVGASPMLSTIAAAGIMIAVNRALAWISLKNPKISALINGKPLVICQDGEINWKNMDKICLSESELYSSLRLERHQNNLAQIKLATMETNGRISFILKTD